MKKNVKTSKRLPLGRVVQTSGSTSRIEHTRLITCLGKHAACEWGDAIPPDDRLLNDAAVLEGDRVLSVWRIDELDARAGKFWIITEHDRSVTTVLLPEEY